MSEPQPKRRNFWQILAIVAIGVAITASTLAYFEKGRIDERVADAAAQQSKQVTKDFEQSFIDRNQTREGLIDIIERQRAETYAAYPVQFGWCSQLVPNTQYAKLTDMELEGTEIVDHLTCVDSDGKAHDYTISYDTMTGRYCFDSPNGPNICNKGKDSMPQGNEPA